MTAEEFIEELKKYPPDTPVVAYCEKGDRYMETGLVEFAPKMEIWEDFSEFYTADAIIVG